MKDKKILIIDDSKMASFVLEDILREDGFTNIIRASNGKDALNAYTNEKPDLVLLDIIMPNMNGIDVLRKLGKNAKVIIASAVGQDSIIKEAKELGALDYLVKPLNKEEVLKKVLFHLK